jgi:hypothetical protein
VAEEAAVLDRQHRLHEVVGQLLVLDEAPFLAALVVEVGDELRLERLRQVRALALLAAQLEQLVLLEARHHRLVGGVGAGARLEHDRLVPQRELPGADARAALLVLEPVEDLHEARGRQRHAGAQLQRPRVEPRRHQPALARQLLLHDARELQVVVDEPGGAHHERQREGGQQQQHQAQSRLGVDLAHVAR